MGDGIRDELRGFLLEQDANIPTSRLGRMGRMAWAAVGHGGLIYQMRRAAGREDAANEPMAAKDLARIVTRFGRLKGLAMKMAQIMSYIDVALPEELRQALSVLQTHAQPMPFERVRELVESELGEAGQTLLRRMESTPAAAASIGQVHRATLPDGTVVAVKIQYPEIEDAIRKDFGPAAIGTKFASLIYPRANVDAFVEEARTRFLEECDYEAEARWQQRFAELLADDPVAVVPAVHPDYCSRRVLTTSWIDGVGLNDFLAGDPDQETRDRIGHALFQFYIGTLFRDGLYNCDPHPGNYVFLDDGRLAFLDYGCTRAFDPAFVDKMITLTRAVHTDDRDQIHAAFVDLEIVRPDEDYDYDTARSLFRSFFGPMLRDEVTTVETGAGLSFAEMARNKRKLMKLHLPGEFLFLFRIRFGLLSVLSQLGARANWHSLELDCLAAHEGARP